MGKALERLARNRLVDTPEKFEKFYSEFKKQQIFALDTETTLTNPVRAELVGMSFAWQPDRAFSLPVRAPMAQKHLDIKDLRAKIAPLLADENVKKIGQNIKYDLIVLTNAAMPVGGIFFDTMVASYCLDAERRSHSLDAMAKDFIVSHPGR